MYYKVKFHNAAANEIKFRITVGYIKKLGITLLVCIVRVLISAFL